MLTPDDLAQIEQRIAESRTASALTRKEALDAIADRDKLFAELRQVRAMLSHALGKATALESFEALVRQVRQEHNEVRAAAVFPKRLRRAARRADAVLQEVQLLLAEKGRELVAPAKRTRARR